LTDEEKSLLAPQSISIPVGLTQQRLPIGFQILGNIFQESLLFKLAFLLEKK